MHYTFTMRRSLRIMPLTLFLKPGQTAPYFVKYMDDMRVYRSFLAPINVFGNTRGGASAPSGVFIIPISIINYLLHNFIGSFIVAYSCYVPVPNYSRSFLQ